MKDKEIALESQEIQTSTSALPAPKLCKKHSVVIWRTGDI